MWILQESYEWTGRVGSFVNLGDEINWHVAAINAGGCLEQVPEFGYLTKPTYSRGRRWDNAGDTGGRVFSYSEGVETLIIGIGSGISGSRASIRLRLLGSGGSGSLSL